MRWALNKRIVVSIKRVKSSGHSSLRFGEIMTRPNVAHSRLQTVDEIVLESLSRLIFYISLCAFSTATGGCAPQAWLSDANDLMGRQELSEALIRYELSLIHI